MSIPPLVCSTPPPPDQCEDDKDPEDFDLQYNLSQDDDYDYGSFSTYNHFQSAISNNKPLENPINNRTNNNVNNGELTETDKDKNYSGGSQWTGVTAEKKTEQDKPDLEVTLNTDGDLETERIPNSESNQDDEFKLANEDNDRVNKKLNNEEEINVEDLNLTVEGEDSIGSSIKNEVDPDTDSDKCDSSDKGKATYIPDDMTSSINDNNTNESALPVDDKPITYSSIEEAPNPIEDQSLHPEDESELNNRQIPEPNINEKESVDEIVLQSPNSINVLNDLDNETDDEFGDFTDFNFSSDNKPSIILTECDNPWENNQPDPEFGEFEAHFDDTGNTKSQHEDKSLPDSQTQQIDAENDDDFGDFDDFKSSMQENKDIEEIHDPLSHVPVLDFQTSENESQILENINKTLYPIFQEDVPEPDSVFEGKLEALLCETWGHLLETDVRQPYIVTWNSSFGQKTLLKALCIDSRNILFGPKWSYNMPKYAANLSAAPLQPQKQSTPSGPSQASQPEPNPDKNTTKPPSTWTDPFTSDGQESSNKENSAIAPKRPTELDIFESALSTKPDKIYSSTLGVQPLRQINLPDTHIFTPTDSETPKSKTIHYDGPSVFLSQSSVEDTKKSAPIALSESPSNVDSKSLDDGDYSDFQDFKGSFSMQTTEVLSANAPASDYVEPLPATQLPTTSTNYSIGILQPIKIEPTMPTLNWPSPGEVKETFDDFSEFTSHSTWNNGIQEIQVPNIKSVKIHNVDIDNLNILTNSSKNIQDTTSKNNDSFDDDFDTFQSALPTPNPTSAVPSIDNFSNVEATSFSPNNSDSFSPTQQTDLDIVFSKIDIVKSDAISLTRPNDILKYTEPSTHNTIVENTPKMMEPVVNISGPPLLGAQTMTPRVLQPTVTSSPIQSNTTQILQPLSLESFSQINWPNPGINLQDLSRFNPVETLNSLKSDLSVSGNSKGASPVHHKSSVGSHPQEEDIWGEFVSSKPKPQQSLPKKVTTFGDDDEWTDFVSSPTVPPQNGVNTISFNVHSNSNLQKSIKQNKLTVQDSALEIPSLNYITPKSSNHSSYNNRHFQNL